MMIRNASTPTAASQAIRSLTAAPYKPLLPHLPAQRTNTKPARHIEDHLSVPLQKTRGSCIESFTYRFRKVHAYSLTSGNWRDVESAFGENRFSRRWNERTDSLWWSVVAFKSFAAKRVVRTYGARKLRTAFIESLRKRGIASDGSWLSSAGQTKDAIMGTACLMPEVEILRKKMKDLVLETDEAVERILSLQDSGGFKINVFKPGVSTKDTRWPKKDSDFVQRNPGSPRERGLKISRG